MFHVFTENAIKVIIVAQEEAKRLNHNHVAPEQLLLGLLAVGKSQEAGSSCCNSAYIHRDARIEVEKLIGRGSTEVFTSEIPFSEEAKRLLEGSWEQAQKLGHTFINEEHLLLALIDQGETVAVQALKNLGIAIDDLKAALKASLAQFQEKPEKRNEP